MKIQLNFLYPHALKDLSSTNTMKLLLMNTVLVFANGVASQAIAFNITAISAANNASRLQCWQLDASPKAGRGAVNFDLGNFDQALVGILPPNATTGLLTNAPKVQ
jgi:hypothetical protein